MNPTSNGKTKEIEENRFPGYVLVEMVMTDEAWFVVRNTPNVTGFVGSHGNRSKPTPLLEEEIRSILLSMGQTVDVIDTNIKEGDVVQIIDGAFMGQEGRVVEIENNKVKIMINMFGAETQAELELYPRIQGRSAVARRHIDLADFFRLRQFPCQRVFAAAQADDENFHGCLLQIQLGVVVHVLHVVLVFQRI